MAENDIEALAVKADLGPWHFDKSTGQIYRRPDHLTKYIIAEMESSNDANGELVVALVNSLTAPERPPIMLDIAAASETDEMWKRRWLALCQMYERDPCFVDSNGKWGLRDFLDYAAEVCGFIASPTALTALRSTTAEPNPAPAEGDLPDDDWVPSPFTGNRLGTHPTDSAAKDAEIARLRDALKHAQGRFLNINIELTTNRSKGVDIAIRYADLGEDCIKMALANRGEAGALAKEQDRG